MTSVSVIMAVYNEPLDWLRKAIDSVLGQTLRNIELIVINDNPGRPDLPGFLDDYHRTDDRIRVIQNGENMGPAAARNRGLEIAQGEYIAILDADDIALPRRLQLQYEFLKAHKDVFLVGSAVKIIDQEGREKETVVMPRIHEQVVDYILSKRLPFYHSAVTFRNEGYRYRTRFSVAMDADFYLVLLTDGKRFGNLKEVLLQYRQSNRSITAQRKRQQIILKLLAHRFYQERISTGQDSCSALDFHDLESLVSFLGLDPRQLETTVLREEIVFALGGGNLAEARAKYRLYAACAGAGTHRLALWLFVTFPFLYKAYRKLSYDLLRR